MARCYICGVSVSNDAEYISFGFLKRKTEPICDKCGHNLKIIVDTKETETKHNLAQQYFEKSACHKTAKKYIESCVKRRIAKQNKKQRPSRGTIYFVDRLLLSGYVTKNGSFVPSGAIKIPQNCTNCMCETTEKELLRKTDKKREGNYIYTKSMEIGMPLCPTCSKSRKRRSACIAAFSVDFNSFGILFTNKEYAELFSSLNNATLTQFEDNGFFSAMC